MYIVNSVDCDTFFFFFFGKPTQILHFVPPVQNAWLSLFWCNSEIGLAYGELSGSYIYAKANNKTIEIKLVLELNKAS